MIAEANLPLDRLTTLCAQMTKATNDFRRCINEAKELHVRQIEKMQEERDAALLVARAHEDGDDPNNMQHMPGIDLPPSKKVNLHLFLLGNEHNQCKTLETVRQLQSRGNGRMLAVSPHAVLLDVLPAQGLERASGGVHA